MERKLYAIWVFSAPGDSSEDWAQVQDSDGCHLILAFVSKRKAQREAANFFGFDSYTETKQLGWAEVREYTPRKGDLVRVQF